MKILIREIIIIPPPETKHTSSKSNLKKYENNIVPIGTNNNAKVFKTEKTLPTY